MQLRDQKWVPYLHYIGIIILCVGTARIIISLSSMRIDGLRPIQDEQIYVYELIIIYLCASVAQGFILVLAKARIFGQFVFFLGSSTWCAYALRVLSGEFDCTYWHQGAIVCKQFDSLIPALWVATGVANLVFFASCIYRKGHTYKVLIGGALATFYSLAIFVAYMSQS